MLDRLFGQKSRVALVLVIALAMVLTLGLGGCKKRLSESEYEDAVETALEDITEANEDMYGGLMDIAMEVGEEDEIGKDGLEDLQTTMDDYDKAMSDVAKTFDKYLPPKDYEDLHEDIVAGLEAFNTLSKTMKDTVDDLKDDSTGTDIGDAMDEAFEELEDLEDDVTAFGEAVEELGLEDAAGDLGLGF